MRSRVFVFLVVFLVVFPVVARPLDASRTVEDFLVPIAVDSRARAPSTARFTSTRAGRPESDQK